MIPFGNSTVTLIRRVETTVNGKTKVGYKRHVLSGCSWKQKTIWRQIGTDMQLAAEVVCRIPLNQTAPATGDYLFLGDVRLDITSVSSLNAAISLHRKTGVMRVASVANNGLFGVPMPHIAARGDTP